MRIPSTKSNLSPYITPEGHKRLREEFNYLWKIKRPKVTQAVADAAAMGDRSENAEYIYGKKQLRQIDSRMRFLQQRLNELKIVDRPAKETTKIFFGAWVELKDDNGNEYKYRIVGRDEFDSARNYISIDSPMAKALLGKKKDDEVVVSRPNGKTTFIVVSIHYPF
ncbi:MAG: transcription elongation factor GreB [Nitrospirae bacterium]|nr:transcription elongation factor GreB [Nitrospirota bacterium]